MPPIAPEIRPAETTFTPEEDQLHRVYTEKLLDKSLTSQGVFIVAVLDAAELPDIDRETKRDLIVQWLKEDGILFDTDKKTA